MCDATAKMTSPVEQLESFESYMKWSGWETGGVRLHLIDFFDRGFAECGSKEDVYLIGQFLSTQF